MRKPVLLFALFAMLLPVTVRAESPDTPDSLQKLYTDGNYKELVPKINKVLALKGPAAAQFKKYDLLVMKGDASLHMHAKSQALDAFKSAVTATTTPDEVSTALATSELIRQANGNFTYLRKTRADKDDKPAPIDIIEPASRKLAFAALEADLLAKIKPRFEVAIKSATLAQAAQVAGDKDLPTLKAVEIAATGTNGDSQQMLGDLGTRVTTLIDVSLEQLGRRLDADLEAVKNGARSGTQGASNAMSVSALLKDVNGIDSESRDLADYIKNISPMLGSGSDLKNAGLQAKKICDAAEELLNADKQKGH